MSPSFNSFGSNPSVSQLVWDTDLVIPDGKAIESASGEVGIVGDVSISGSLAADNTVHGVEEVTSALITATNANITTPTLNGKNLVNILVPLTTPISVTSSAKSFTVNNPYNTNVSGTITSTGSTSNPDTNFISMDGSVVLSANPGQTKTAELLIPPGNHTITQKHSDSIKITAINLSFYAFN